MFEYTHLFLLLEALFTSLPGVDLSSDDPVEEILHSGTCVPLVRKCYIVIYEGHTWKAASERCLELTSLPLAAIKSEAENTGLKVFLKHEIETNPNFTAACIPTNRTDHGIMFWTSGQRQIENKCNTPFVWKQSSNITQPFGFTNWARGQPDCNSNKESCVHFWAQKNLAWNDIRCDVKACPVCEFSVPESMDYA